VSNAVQTSRAGESEAGLSAPAGPVPPPGRTAVPHWAVLVPLAVVAAAHLPLLAAHARQLWLRPHYQFFPLVLLGAAVLLRQRLRGLGRLTPGPVWPSALVFGPAFVLLAAAEVLDSSWLGTVATLVMLLGAAHALGGRPLLVRALPAWALLWLAVPPPLELDRDLILWLQGLTAQWSSRVLDLLGVWHVMAGNVVEINGRRLLVEEACSGINSLFSVLACTLFFVFLARRPPVRATLLVLAAVAWVLAANVARVAGVAFVTARWGIDLTEGYCHDAFGLALFGLALLLVASTDQLLGFLLAPGPGRKVADGAPRLAPPAPALTPLARSVTWAFAAAYAALLAAHLALYGFAVGGGPATGGAMAAAVETLEAAGLPSEAGGWRRQEFTTEHRNPGSAFGEFSRIWTYRQGENTCLFSLDYPFPAWHDLTRCYTGQGWAMEGQAVRPGRPGDGPAAGGFVAVRLTKPGYRSGYLLFGECDRDGRPLEPRRGAAYLALDRHRSVLGAWLDRGRGAAPAPPPAGPVYQVQLFAESYAPLTPAEEADAEQLFGAACQAVCRHCRPGACE
jgi:exosortase